MCMMQAPHNRNVPVFKRRRHEEKKSIFYDKEIRMKPDVNFIDERKRIDQEEKKSILDKILELF